MIANWPPHGTIEAARRTSKSCASALRMWSQMPLCGIAVRCAVSIGTLPPTRKAPSGPIGVIQSIWDCRGFSVEGLVCARVVRPYALELRRVAEAWWQKEALIYSHPPPHTHKRMFSRSVICLVDSHALAVCVCAGCVLATHCVRKAQHSAAERHGCASHHRRRHLCTICLRR
jgi:hypothetical protein